MNQREDDRIFFSCYAGRESSSVSAVPDLKVTQDPSRKLASLFPGPSSSRDDIITRNSTSERSATGFDHMLSRMAALAARVSHLRTSHTGPTSSSGVEYSKFSRFLLSFSLFTHTPYSYYIHYIYISLSYLCLYVYSYV